MKKIVLCLMVGIFSMFASVLFGQDKVVVIPLTVTVQAPLEPYAPVTTPNPSDSDYSVGLYTVTDKVTGLVWQKEDDHIAKTWDAAWDYCQGLEHPPMKSLKDWRLPRVDELMTIVNYNNVHPAINSNVFPNTSSSSYWSATTTASDSGSAWVVIFNEGDIENDGTGKQNEKYVRCVRRSSIRPSGFKDNGDGTVTDMATGLMWQSDDDNALRNWFNADSYCQGLTFGDKQDWRLPDIKELQSIIDTKINTPNPAIDATAFPGTDSMSYWSATSHASLSFLAWAVDFEDGEVLYYDKLYAFFFVRCVR